MGLTAWEATACLARLDAFLVALLALCPAGTTTPPAKNCPRAARLLAAWNTNSCLTAWWPFTPHVGKWCTKFCCQAVGPVIVRACGGNVIARQRLSRLLLATLGEQHFPWGLLTPARERLRRTVCDAKAFEKPLSVLSWAMRLNAEDANSLVDYLEHFLDSSQNDTRRQSAAHALLCEGVRCSKLLDALQTHASSALDEHQRAAVCAPCDGGAVVIEAGPGAGKTRTLGTRCLHLIIHHMGHRLQAIIQRPEDILCVTFTTRARYDLWEKLTKSGMPLPTVLTLDSFTLVIIGDICQRARLPMNSRPVWVHTTHEQWADSCRRAASQGWPSPPDVSLDRLLADILRCPAVTDAPSLLRLTKPLAEFVCESFRGRGRLLRSGPDEGTLTALAQLIEQRWCSPHDDKVAVALSLTPRWLSIEGGKVTVHHAQMGIFLTTLANVLMQHANYFAYDCDRELVALALLQRVPPHVDVPLWMRSEQVKNAAATVRELFKRKYVLLDEFQDTSVAQLDVVLALTIDTAATTMTTPRVRLTVVGDSDQAIYAFRGASMQPLQARLASLVPPYVRCSLCVNYRSTPAIIAVCEALIALNRTDDKAMRPSQRWGAAALAPAFDVFPVSVLLCQAAAQQESCALRCIQKWHALGVPYASMAVLCRVKAAVQSFKDSIRGTDIVVRALKEKEEDRFSGQGDMAQPKQDALSVGTIHSAKGIEWDVVCIIDALEAAQDIKARNDSNAALIADIKAERWAEERRVVFVGLSRPRRALHITHPIRAGGRSMDVEPAQSEFLQDIQRSAGSQLVVVRSDALDSLPWPHNLARLDMGPYGEAEDDGPE